MPKLLTFLPYFAAIAASSLLVAHPLEAGTSEANHEVLHVFRGQPDGAVPEAGLIMGTGGAMYGTTSVGGTGACSNDGGTPGCGTVFAVDSSGQETVLYSFTGHPTDGEAPEASLFQDSTGNLYGTTMQGGPKNNGTVFKLDRTGKETVLYSFCSGGYPCPDGAMPLGSVIVDEDGSIYGTTYYGGAEDYGTVFKVDSGGTETVLYSFTGGADGAYPLANLVFDKAGNLYGTATHGGSNKCQSGCGVVFTLSPSGEETVLHSFTGAPDGAEPDAGLIWDEEGNLYSTTGGGGSTNRHGSGTIFRLAPSGKETILHRFSGIPNGHTPSGVVRDTAGDLYGTAGGGIGRGCSLVGCGVVYKLSETGELTLLYKFKGGADGRGATPGLVRETSSGALYGTTATGGKTYGGSCLEHDGGCGTVFKLTP